MLISPTIASARPPCSLPEGHEGLQAATRGHFRDAQHPEEGCKEG
jgi:hypothetical protein